MESIALAVFLTVLNVGVIIAKIIYQNRKEPEEIKQHRIALEHGFKYLFWIGPKNNTFNNINANDIMQINETFTEALNQEITLDEYKKMLHN